MRAWNRYSFVSDTQLTLIQIDNYGPWTVSPTPRAEPDIQTLQARLYADISQFMNAHGSYVFFTRFDNMVAVTNGMGAAEFRRLQESVRNRYPVTVSLSTARDPSPATALSRATAELQAAGSAQDGTRREILTVAEQGGPPERDGDVTIAHFDVVDATGRFTDQIAAYETYIEIESAVASIMRFLYTEYEGLAFFVGGDNVIAVCPALASTAYRHAIEYVEDQTDVRLQVGVGSGRRARDAGMAAKHALERCRAEATPVEIAQAPQQSGD